MAWITSDKNRRSNNNVELILTIAIVILKTTNINIMIKTILTICF